MKNLRNAFPDAVDRAWTALRGRRTDTTTMTTTTTKTTTTGNLLWIEAVRRTGSGYFLTPDSAAYVQRSLSFLSFRSQCALARERKRGASGTEEKEEEEKERKVDREKDGEGERERERKRSTSSLSEEGTYPMPRALICNRPHMRATPGRTIRPTGKAPACKLSSIHEPITYRAVPLGTVQDSLHGASSIWRGERGSWRGLSCIRCTTSVETRIRTSPRVSFSLPPSLPPLVLLPGSLLYPVSRYIGTE